MFIYIIIHRHNTYIFIIIYMCVWNPLSHAERSCLSINSAGGGCMVWQSSTNEDTAFPWWYRSGTPDRRTCQFADRFQLLIKLLHCVVSNLYSGLSMTYLGLLKAFSNIHPFFSMTYLGLLKAFSNIHPFFSMTYLGLLKAFSNINPFFSFNLSYLQCVWAFDLTWSHRRLLSRRPRVGAGHFPYRSKATP